jgi:hypothetical protein
MLPGIRDVMQEPTPAPTPVGGLVTVPMAPDTGAIEHPFVSVKAVTKYLDPVFVTTALGSLGAIADVAVEYLIATGSFQWKLFIAGCISAVVAYCRNHFNTVTK